jgi:site-specific recombinase XerD
MERVRVQAPPGSLARLHDSWMLSLQARNLSGKTLRIYSEALRQFTAFVTDRGMPTEAANVRREHVEAFLVDQLARLSPATARNRYSALRQFFEWCIEEGEVAAPGPMARMSPPAQDEPLIPIVKREELVRLFRACQGREFTAVRDSALVWTLLSGLRLGECTALHTDDVELPHAIVVRRGKGGLARRVPLDIRAARALDRWLRMRPTHPDADRTPALWLGARGVLTDSGIAQALERRCEVAGIERVRPHQLRHTSAHLAKSAGMSDSIMMSVFGWRSPQMVGRYGRSAAHEAAAAAFAQVDVFRSL